MIKVIRSLMVCLAIACLFALSMFVAQPQKALANDEVCELLPIIDGEVINHFEMKVNCPPIESGYRYFDWGDGSSFDMLLDANGDSAMTYTHDYAYEVGGLTVYTAGINYDQVEGLDYTVQIWIDDRPEESFAISDVNVITGPMGVTWEWPVEIVGEGEFIVSVDNFSCNGLAETYDGSFRVVVEGSTSFNFTNYVKSGFLSGDSDPNSMITIMRDGIVVFSKKVSAPMCEAPKPNIEILTTAPYTRGGSIVVSVSMPDYASKLYISTDFAFFPDSERLPKDCVFGQTYKEIVCTVMGGDFLLDLIESMNPGQETFKVRAVAQFADYNVDYGNGHPMSENEVVLPLQPKFNPSCEISSQKIDVATYRFDFSWEDNNGDGPSIYAGSADANPTHADFSGLSGSGSFTTTYQFSPGAVYTATLFVSGVPGVNCEEVITLQEETPDTVCTIEVREGSAFNEREFKVTWEHSYWDNPRMDYGDDSPNHIFGSAEELLTSGESDWISHAYAWYTMTGRASYVAEFIIPVGLSSVTCSEAIEIRDPNWMPEIVFEFDTFLPTLGK